jgi:ribonuclease HI
MATSPSYVFAAGNDLAIPPKFPDDTKDLHKCVNVRIWADGSCLGNPGPGAYAALIFGYDENDSVIFTDWTIGGEKQTTNNRMELHAALQAFKHLANFDWGTNWPRCKITLHVDSEYVKLGIEERVRKWKKTGWISSSGTPVANREIWEQVDAHIMQKYDHTRLQVVWVKSHSKDYHNDLVDQVARAHAEHLKNPSVPIIYLGAEVSKAKRKRIVDQMQAILAAEQTRKKVKASLEAKRLM